MSTVRSGNPRSSGPTPTNTNSSNDSQLEERLSLLLASPNFTVPSYLNLALGGNEADGNGSSGGTGVGSIQEEQELEQKMASLALQLQMRTQSCHDEIGRIGAELQAVVPRCAADVKRLKVGLEGMELDARGLLEGMGGRTGSGNSGDNDGNETDADASAGGVASNKAEAQAQASLASQEAAQATPLQTLTTLHALRAHLTTARSILSAAASWDETIQSIPALLSAHSTNDGNSNPANANLDHDSTTPNLVQAVQALSTLESGARALRHMPEGREERNAALAKLRSQLEILLKPQLLHALKKMDTRLGPLQQCVGMYRNLGKMEVLRKEYVKMRPGGVIGMWFAFGGGGVSGTSSSKSKTTEETKKKENIMDGFYEGEGSLTNTENAENKEEEETAEDFDFSEEANDSSSAAQEGQTSNQQFITWLPTWYNAILELLSEERRQARLVFGKELSPEIVAQVLKECFVPIVGSFEKRLGRLCPLPGQGLVGESGSLEAIAATYEATIQFLSLAYDQMEAWDGQSGNDGGTSEAKQEASRSSPSSEALQTIRSAFLLVASPFKPYQTQLAQVEQHPMGEAASIVAKDVRGVVAGGSIGGGADSRINVFQDAAERLGDLAPFMFPLAEASINRYELLNSGYNAPSTLTAIDSLLSNHASELSIAMGTLSGNATSSSSQTGPEFDEQHVHCALEILRTAGVFKRNLRSFESSVRDRLRILSDSMLNDAFEGSVPDAVSPVQIRTMLAKEACDPSPTYVEDGTGARYPSSVLELRRLAAGDSNQSFLFPKSMDSTTRLARSCQSFVFEVCYAIPERHLRGISALPVWKQEGSGGGAEEDSYGILPQQFITYVGEHMLALVQALEPFASDVNALGLANEVMGGVKEVAVQPWKEFVAAAGCSTLGEENAQLTILMDGKELTKYLHDGSDADESPIDPNDEEEEEDDPDAKASTAFCNQWLDVVGLAVTGRLLERTMRIPRLGKKGAEHLAADLNYIRNMFTALGVAGHPHPLLGYVAKLVTLEENSLKEKIRGRRREKTVSGVLEVIQRAELRIAYVRSISV